MSAPIAMQPFSEPWSRTALRTGALALLVGVGIGLARHRLGMVPFATLMALWFTLGGHFVELLFRNWLWRWVPGGSVGRVLARIALWFAAGVIFAALASLTRDVLLQPGPSLIAWWIAGSGFVAVELLIHLGLRARGQPSFYDGRG